MARGGLLTAVALVALIGMAVGAALLANGQAHAANASVSTGSPTDRFAPNISNISVGDTVTFTWAAGTHVVDLKDVSPDLQIDSSHTSGTTTAFTTPGTYYYYCSIHATEDQATEAHVQANDAMVGKIVVTAASAGSTATPAPGNTPAASATSGAGRTPTTAPAAPSTGSGVAASTSPNIIAIALIAGSALLLAGTGVATVRRRR
jgi:plastocyanin